MSVPCQNLRAEMTPLYSARELKTLRKNLLSGKMKANFVGKISNIRLQN